MLEARLMPETTVLRNGKLYSRWGGRCAGPWMHPAHRRLDVERFDMVMAALDERETKETR